MFLQITRREALVNLLIGFTLIGAVCGDGEDPGDADEVVAASGPVVRAIVEVSEYCCHRFTALHVSS